MLARFLTEPWYRWKAKKLREFCFSSGILHSELNQCYLVASDTPSRITITIIHCHNHLQSFPLSLSSTSSSSSVPSSSPISSSSTLGSNLIKLVKHLSGGRDGAALNLVLSSPLAQPCIWPSPHWWPDNQKANERGFRREEEIANENPKPTTKIGEFSGW